MVKTDTNMPTFSSLPEHGKEWGTLMHGLRIIRSSKPKFYQGCDLIGGLLSLHISNTPQSSVPSKRAIPCKFLPPSLRTKTSKKFRRVSYDPFSYFIYWPRNLINYEKGAGYRSWNQYFRILHKILVKLDQKYVVYNALLPETDVSLIKTNAQLLLF